MVSVNIPAVTTHHRKKEHYTRLVTEASVESTDTDETWNIITTTRRVKRTNKQIHVALRQRGYYWRTRDVHVFFVTSAAFLPRDVMLARY